MELARKFDVVVVGARSAGASTALLLARAGARVLVVDKGAYGTDTLSTHALMRGAVLQLARWGVLPAIVAAGTPPVRSTTFSYLEQDVTVPIEPRFGVSALYAPRRALLDRLLVDAATESGAQFAYGVLVDDLRLDDHGRVRGLVAGRLGQIETDFIVGADGLYSRVARLVGAAPLLEGHHAGGVLYSYWKHFPVDEFYWRFRPGMGMGVIPTNDDASCIFVAVPSQRFRREIGGDVDAAYNRFLREVAPDFEAKFAGARRVERIRGFGGHPGFIRTSSGPGWALVGDASYFKDPITAHGITDALRDAELLARAIVNDASTALKSYESTRLELSRTLFQLTDEIASFARSDADLQTLHRAFSTEMSREVRALAALPPLPEVTTWETRSS
jgi:flavin-dependent dehydrogenase